jgi:hypothetical protein
MRRLSEFLRSYTVLSQVDQSHSWDPVERDPYHVHIQVTEIPAELEKKCYHTPTCYLDWP